MLARNASVAVRAAAIFSAVYLALFASILIAITVASLSLNGDGHHAGPKIAISLTAREQRADGTFRLSAEGPLADFAARNPSLWLIGQGEGRRFSFGPVPAAAERQFNNYFGTLDTARFHVLGVARPLSDSAIERRGDMVIAAGGVNPAAITFLDSLDYFLREGWVPLVVIGGVGLVAMLLAVPLLTRGLKRVAADAASIRPERPDRRIDEASVPRELVPLVRSFNSALDRLAGELGRRKRFIADVAHELRTPLAVASLQVEALEERAEKEDLRRVMARLSHLVAQMVDVERLSLAGQDRSEIDLAELAGDVLADMAPMAMAAGYEVALEVPETAVTVVGDRHAIGRAIGNLVGNAVAHGGGRGQIQVVVSEWRTLDVRDEGPGVPASIHGSLFEPFCRERWDRDGCGLGLHLTREIMRAHGGDALLLAAEGGATFRLEFP